MSSKTEDGVVQFRTTRTRYLFNSINSYITFTSFRKWAFNSVDVNVVYKVVYLHVTSEIADKTCVNFHEFLHCYAVNGLSWAFKPEWYLNIGYLKQS